MSRHTGARRTAVAGLLFALPLGSLMADVPSQMQMWWPELSVVLAGTGAALLALVRRRPAPVRWIRIAELILASIAGVLAVFMLVGVVLSHTPGGDSDLALGGLMVFDVVGMFLLALPTLVFAAVRALWPGDCTV